MGESEFIELDETEEINFNSPECIEAVHSVNSGFKPHWKANQLHDYYEDRKLTYEQVRAIVRSENARFKALDPEYLADFARKGEIERKMPDNLWEIVEELHPRIVPIDEIIIKLKKLLEKSKDTWINKFKNLVGLEKKKEVSCFLQSGYILSFGGKITDIYELDIRNLWNNIAKFTGRRDATDEVVQLLYRRLTSN